MRDFPKALPVIAGVLASILAVPEPMVPSAWAEQNLVVPDGPRAGSRWDRALTPYVPEMIDVLGPETGHNFAAVRKSAQSGISIAAIALAGAYIDRAPCRIGYALPTIDAIQEFNREKLGPAIEQTRALRARVKPQTSRSATGSTTTSKRFPGGSLVLLNANSAADLRLKTLKVGIGDEVDEWADDLDGQGDPFDLYMGRFIAFHATGDWRFLSLSTPTLAGVSRIDGQFKAGDQRLWHVSCPGCGTEIAFEFKNLKFKRRPPYEAHYVAQCCGTIIEHHEKATLVRAGRFKPTNPEGLHPSFHVDALISLLTTWDKIAEAWWKAHGDERKEKAFWNLWLGLPYEIRGDAPDWERLMERREQDLEEGHIPPLGLLLVAGVDVQHSGLWVEVVAFAPDRQSWSITARWLEGETTDIRSGAWPKLDALYQEEFTDAFGGGRRIDAMAVDAGDGGRANQVYAWTRLRPKTFAIQGLQGWTRPAIGTPTRVDVTVSGRKKRRGATLWPIGIWSLKADLYADLRKSGAAAGAEADPPGYCHFGMHNDENYFKQLTAEHLADETFRGRTRKVWKQSRPDNHLHDCRIYAMAMADYLGLRRKTVDQWAALAAERGVPAKLREPDLLSPAPAAAPVSKPATARQKPAGDARARREAWKRRT